MAEKTVEQLKAELATLTAERDALVAAKPKRVFALKVSEKGAVSIYGLNAKWPVTLYAQQMENVLDHTDAIRAFIKENAAKLVRK